ncbi:MAG: hypothetical protein NT126_06045 [Bacteroidetes bacterium]|nr:hypothetical protein [Bacteroidota bacterium]
MKTKIISCFLVGLVAAFMVRDASAQFSVRDSSVSFVMLGGTFAYQIPGGDMAKRFGNNFNVGGTFQWKTKKNWIFGIDGEFLFSERVKETNILDKISTSQGYIIGEDGFYADILLYERGLMFSAKAGKIFPVIGPNPNSGLVVTLGAGLLQHKIRIEDKRNSAPQLSDEYKKGYDRLTNGLSVTEFLGYVNFSNRRMVNFMGGFEFTQAFTKNRRDFNFDTMEKDTKSRLDLLFGFRFAWLIPIYKRVPRQYYYN